MKRRPDRGFYGRDVIDAILDEGLVCHLGFRVGGQPYVIPTTYARAGDTIVIHGSPASRLLRSLRDGVAVCLTVTLLDGLVLARSAFHTSMNYRSVVVLGTAREITDGDEKVGALRALVDHILPGRWDAIRPPNETEIKGTLVLALPLSEASAKVREGGPLDDDADLALPVWAGHIPLSLTRGHPVPDPALAGG